VGVGVCMCVYETVCMGVNWCWKLAVLPYLEVTQEISNAFKHKYICPCPSPKVASVPNS